MKIVQLFALVVTITFSGQALSVETKSPEHCEKLVLILKTALSQVVKGDFSNRVRIALDAHKRLGCPPSDLLDVLRIQQTKAGASNKG